MWPAKTDQTGRMARPIRVFAGSTCHFVGFVMHWLKFFINLFIAYIIKQLLTIESLNM